jgi:hypothetical protein
VEVGSGWLGRFGRAEVESARGALSGANASRVMLTL